MSWLRFTLGGVLLLGVVIFFGLPPALRAMGFHPNDEIPKFDLAGSRALIVTTSHGALGDTGRATGVLGSEMTVPYYAFLETGLEVDIASVKGGEIPVEPWSMSWPLATEADRRFSNDPAAMAMLRNSRAISEVDPEAYDAVSIAGGLVTGQNQNIGYETAHRMLELLAERVRDQ